MHKITIDNVKNFLISWVYESMVDHIVMTPCSFIILSIQAKKKSIERNFKEGAVGSVEMWVEERKEKFFIH